jgi:hypothetical protein
LLHWKAMNVSRPFGNALRPLAASLASLALIAGSLGGVCECLKKLTPTHARSCCCSTDGTSSSMTVRAQACGDDCGIASTQAPVGEVVGASDTGPAAGLLVPVPALHQVWASGFAPPWLAASGHPVPFTLRPILRI